ncbi:MAG: zinc ribbon domain-containing protein YjdM [Thiobacillus sp.]
MNTIPACPQCGLENTYPDGAHYLCPDCGFEWPQRTDAAPGDAPRVVKDAHGNVLADGDTVVLIKDLRVKGASVTLKMGAKIKGIRIVEGDHEIDARTEAGNILLKACFLKKA